MKKVICMALTLLLCLSALNPFPAVASDPLADAFQGSGRIFLEEVDWQGMPDPEVLENATLGFLDLSPDGKTMLCLQAEETPTGDAIGYHLSLIRDKEIIPVTVNASRGDGDPYGKIEMTGALLRDLPGSEGISWSADGRYCTFSTVRKNLERAPEVCLDIPVVDTLTAEMWLADSWQKTKRSEDGYTLVLLSKMSLSGEYVYYLILGREGGHNDYYFCRCATEGGSREILCKIPRDEQGLFEPTTLSDMFESVDGSWLLEGITGSSKEGKQNTALFRLAPGENAWIIEAIPTMIPRVFASGRFLYSPDSGYSLMVMAAVGTQGADVATMGMMKRVNLVRVRPTEASPYEVWYMQENSDAFGDVTMIRGETYLQYFQTRMFDRTDPGIPAEYDVQQDMLHMPPSINNACFSPDGRYALLYVRQNGAPDPEKDRLYLLSLETMEIRQVEVPEGTIGISLTAGSPLGMRYQPGMVWHSDGTLVMLTEKNGLRLFNLTVH